MGLLLDKGGKEAERTNLLEATLSSRGQQRASWGL